MIKLLNLQKKFFSLELKLEIKQLVLFVFTKRYPIDAIERLLFSAVIFRQNGRINMSMKWFPIIAMVMNLINVNTINYLNKLFL